LIKARRRCTGTVKIEEKTACKVLVGKRPFWRLWYRLDDNIKMDHIGTWRMVSSGLLRRVALVRTDVSQELSASFIRVTKIDELAKTPAVTSNLHTLRRNFFAACVGCS
jgi:hypothetical protein